MSVISVETHNEVVDVTNPDHRPSVLMIVANPGVNATTGQPVGFWAGELFHSYHAFVQKRYDVTIASPEGGKVEVDTLSDPRDESKMSADDLISMGALNTPAILAQLENTPALRDLDLAAYDAILVCGGQGPMFQFRDHEDLKGAITTRAATTSA
jgi:putative intracellular protease/amidase